MNIEIFESIDEIADFVFVEWIKSAEKAIDQRGQFCAVLSGGRTPVPIYHKLTTLNERLVWERTHLFLADERNVSQEHQDHNGRMIQEALILPLKLPRSQIHFPQYHEDVTQTAYQYEQNILSFFYLPSNQKPVFDFIILGLGKDGHTASLFPGDDACLEKERAVVSVDSRQVNHQRITMTFPVINQAHEVICVACGSEKSDVIKKMRKGNKEFPAARIQQAERDALFVFDRAAIGE